MAYRFTPTIDIIGINPFVFVPDNILQKIFTAAGKDKGPIQVKGSINKKAYTQTLVKYAGHWRLYINTIMLKDSPKHVGKKIAVRIDYDQEDRTIPLHSKLKEALNKNKKAKKIYESLAPSLQKEINRYISSLKTEENINKNSERAIGFLLGKERFVGRPPIGT